MTLLSSTLSAGERPTGESSLRTIWRGSRLTIGKCDSAIDWLPRCVESLWHKVNGGSSELSAGDERMSPIFLPWN